MYCVSCGTPQPDESLMDEVVDEPVDSPFFTSYLRELDYKPKPLDLPLYAPRSEPETSSKPMLGSMPMPTLEPMSPLAPVAPPARRAKDELAKRLENLRRLKDPTTGSPSRKAVSKLVILVAVIAVAGGIATSLAHKESSISVTEVTASPPIVVSHEDDAYFEELASINEARNALVDITNERWEAWLALNSDGLPTAEYLVVDELSAFQEKLRSMPVPASDAVTALHAAWAKNVNALVIAERTLSAEPSQATLDAELEAWNTEDASYTELYDYMQARE